MKYEMIIFDFDGTLVESTVIADSIIAECLNERGYHEYTQELCTEEFSGHPLKEVSELIHKKHPEISAYDLYNEMKLKAYTKIAEVKALPGAEKLLEELGDFPKCIASNGALDAILRTMNMTGLNKYFPQDNVFTYEMVYYPKPDPELFLYAAERMGGYAPEKCLVIEDSIVGATAAIKANMDVLIIIPPYRQHKDIIKAGMENLSVTGIIEELSQIRDHLK